MRFAIISDIHEDIESLTACLNKIEKVGCDEIISLGDICGFSIPYYKYLSTRNASECIRLIKQNCKYSVIGNHDLYAIRKLPENLSSFKYPDNWYDLSYQQRKQYAESKVWLYEENELDALLDNDSYDYLNSLPEYLEINAGNLNLFLSHYLFPDLTGCTRKLVLNTKDFYTHYNKINNKDNTIAIFGHMHPQSLLRIVNNDIVVNKKPLKSLSGVHGVSGPAVTQNSAINGFIVIDTDTEQVIPYFLRKLWI